MNRIKIALTGGIGSGKSAVAAILQRHGYFVIDCDEITKKLYQKQSTVKLIADTFGCEFVSDSKIDTKKLGAAVFADEKKLKKLNLLVHPLIFEEMKAQTEKSGADIVFVQIPLLFETCMQNYFDKIWLITAKEEARISRVKNRDNLDETQIKNRINSQMKDEEKAKFADVVINNDGSLQDLQETVANCIKNL